ncbi:integrase core domain-containing protein [Pseudonocardia sp. T1-2H]|uniref:integrase core domain-containing protein n=1 Tax=Pseudonocardia sp. T1-2H TaxID=3128899 RepID=UPI004053A914
MGSIGDCFDNALAESFFSSMQVELLDRRPWRTRQELASAIFEWIEAFYNPVRRHSGLDYLSPSTTNEPTPRSLARPEPHTPRDRGRINESVAAGEGHGRQPA